MKDTIILDLDGTLCDWSHRIHLAHVKEWDQFHAGIPDDKVHTDVVMFVRMLPKEHSVLICTGRNGAHRNATERWLRDNNIAIAFDHMLMRPDNDRRQDHELKLALVDEHFGSRQEALARVLLVLDDREKVVEAWRNAGFRCWQVQAGSY